MEQILDNLIEAFNIIIDEFKRFTSTYRNILLKCKAIREKVKEHEDNYKLFRHRYTKTNRLNSQVYNRKQHRYRCRSTI